MDSRIVVQHNDHPLSWIGDRVCVCVPYMAGQQDTHTHTRGGGMTVSIHGHWPVM